MNVITLYLISGSLVKLFFQSYTRKHSFPKYSAAPSWQKAFPLLYLSMSHVFGSGAGRYLPEKRNLMKKDTPKRIAAVVCVILLAALYIVTLLTAIFNFDGAGRLFRICLTATVGLPVLLWFYIWLYGRMTNRHTIASIDTKGQPQEEGTTEKSEPDREVNEND